MTENIEYCFRFVYVSHETFHGMGGWNIVLCSRAKIISKEIMYFNSGLSLDLFHQVNVSDRR